MRYQYINTPESIILFSTASTCSVRFIRVRIYHVHQAEMEEEGFSHLDLTADPTHLEDAEELGFG
jgi:hypothetical protein